MGNGADSVVVYEQWRKLHALGLEGSTWETSPILKAIRDYNIDDCNSTQELTHWLRTQQAELGVTYAATRNETDTETKAVSDELNDTAKLRDELLEQSVAMAAQCSTTAALMANIAWMLEFHRRENKPVYWRFFERLGLSDLELIDDLDCLADCKRTQRAPFKAKPGSRQFAFEYRFDPDQAFKGGAKTFYLLGVETDDGKPASVSWVQAASQMNDGLIVVQSNAPPPDTITLIPNEIINPRPMPEAIFRFASQYKEGQFTDQPSAPMDFLKRAKPRFQTGFLDNTSIIPKNTKPQDLLPHIIAAVKNLDKSYLTIQGPPGAGKTYTGKHIIAELISQGAKIGIASNSHKAINNLLLSTANYLAATNEQLFATTTFACTKNTDPELEAAGINIIQNSKLISYVQPACVLGTTAWGFAREDMQDQLDYLFVDEARSGFGGQFNCYEWCSEKPCADG